MLRTLFGELAPRLMPGARSPDEPVAYASADADAVATPQVRARPRVERGVDVVVDASAAVAIRTHFAATRADLGAAGAMITLLDPSHLWAPQVLAALSTAAGQPLERLNLRERGTLRTLAVIERTTVPRHDAAPLKVYHPDVRATGPDQEAIASALAEGSHLTAVIVGAMQPPAVLALVQAILDATRQPEWRCPWLVFLLPPGAPALRQRILAQPWPAHVRAAAMCEPMAGASAVWNTVLTAWEAATASPRPLVAREPAPGAEPRGADPAPLSPHGVQRALQLVSRTDGLLAFGVVNLGCGDLLCTDSVGEARDELARSAAALCAARQAHAAASAPDSPAPDELLITMGPRQALLRSLPATSSTGFVALVDRSQANLALLRFRLLEAERYLA